MSDYQGRPPLCDALERRLHQVLAFTIQRAKNTIFCFGHQESNAQARTQQNAGGPKGSNDKKHSQVGASRAIIVGTLSLIRHNG